MKIATFDIETDGFLEQTKQVWCAAIKNHDTGAIKTFTPDNINLLCDYLDTFDCLIGHNCVLFDFPVLKKIFGWSYEGKIVDTLLMSRLQRPNRTGGRAPHSVEAWGERLGDLKRQHEDWTEYSGDMLERCKQDVRLQYKIYQTLLAEGRGMGWGKAHKLNVNIFRYLQLQESTGFTIDVEHLNGCIKTLDRWIDRINRSLLPHLPNIVDVLETKKDGEYRYVAKPFKKDGTYSNSVLNWMQPGDTGSVGGPFTRISCRPVDLNSTVEVKDFLLSQGWIPAKWNEKHGQQTSPNLSKDDPFEGIQTALGRLVAKRIQCRQRRSVLEGWHGDIREDSRLPTRVGGIATTGRLRHLGVVNIPSPHSRAFFAKQMRQCFIAQPGWTMVGCDSKGNQMRQLAGRMGDDEFTQAVLHGNSENGTDLHSLNQKKSGAASRSLAKNFFYGSILFGAGDAKTAQLLNTTKEKAKQIKATYMAGMPKLTALLEKLSQEWRLTAKQRFNKRWNRVEYYNGYIKGIDGRSILVAFEKDLLCYALQSDEAIQMGVAYVMIHKRAEQRGWRLGEDWNMLIWMHDEVQMECKPKIADELGQLACDAIRWAGEFLGMKCEHDGDYLIGENWFETH